MKLNRRRFISTTLAGASALALNRSLAPAAVGEPTSTVNTNPFQPVRLGKTGLKVTLIGAGTGMRGFNRQSNMTRLGKEKFEALLRYEFEQGIRLFDCADLYGSHPFVASALKPIPRDQYVLCSKIWFNRGGIPEADRPDANIVVDRFRKELETDYIDLVLIHCMTDPKWTDAQKRQMDILDDLKSKKIIRAHGVSVHSLEAMQAAAESPWVDSVHVRINAFGDSMDRRDPAEVVPTIKKLRAAGKGVVGMKLIGEGRYRNAPEKIDESLRYVLKQDCVDTMIVGIEKPEELDDFAKRLKSALEAHARQA